ncbi:MAG: sugar ABC transporter substrate-binding protein [Ruminococcus sp.]|jgi:ribose transport system substrate-binding protein|nr:sugar ABC transporter substrate-binding protein [Ruminococcus sp.]
MKKRNKWFALAISMSLVFSTAALAGCGAKEEKQETAPKQEDSAGTEKEGSGKKFAYCTSTLNNPFMTTIGDALKEACEANGDELVIYDPQYDQAKQISQIEDAITQGVDGIFLLPVDSDGVKNVLQTAKDKDIPVIALDNPVTDVDLVAANVASDNFNAGHIVGEAMIKDFPDGAKIAVIDSPTMVACVDRFDGFKAALEEAGMTDKFEICAQQDAQASLEKAMPIADNMIQANPDIEAFYGINDPTALGIIAALQAADKLEGIKIYGVDGSPDGKSAIENGTLQVTAAQSPVGIAQTSYDNMLKVLDGGTIEKDIKVETFKIDKDNVSEYGVDGWQ